MAKELIKIVVLTKKKKKKIHNAVCCRHPSRALVYCCIINVLNDRRVIFSKLSVLHYDNLNLIQIEY